MNANCRLQPPFLDPGLDLRFAHMQDPCQRDRWPGRVLATEVSAAAPDGAGARCNVARTRPGRPGDAARRRSARDRDTRGAAFPHTRSAKEFARGDRTGALMTLVPLPAKT